MVGCMYEFPLFRSIYDDDDDVRPVIVDNHLLYIICCDFFFIHIENSWNNIKQKQSAFQRIVCVPFDLPISFELICFLVIKS